ncbi:MAG: tetratricopeptide repeat protein [Flavobacteriales bacterium]|nr:MAG: tetratricopeptide repeat protein [Flavobacteriales bacterium]
MKTYYSLLLAFVVAFSVSAQKKQLKTAQKLVDAASFDAALTLLEDNSDLLRSAEPKYAAHYHYLLGAVQQAGKEFYKAVEAFDTSKSIEAKGGLNKYTQLINVSKASFINDIINHAVDLNSKGNYNEASKLLYLAYELDDENLDYLYFSASSAVNSGDYENALPYYLTLKEKNYTGSVTKFYATEVSTGIESEVDQNTYNIYKKSKDFTNLRTGLSESRLPEIVKNIALIHVSNGDNEAAMKSIKDARKFSPKDVGLILTEADLYIKLGDEARFGALMQEAIAQDPTNAMLYYNLGVVNGNEGKRDKAKDYYKKAIELDPNYEATYLNLSAVILEGEADIVEEMNSLGTSASDNRKYDELKSKREALFLEAVPYLEQLVKINPKNADAITTLKNIFGTIGDTANFKKYRDILEAL